jgi:coenzyme PQQ precursor peptide PqqA
VNGNGAGAVHRRGWLFGVDGRRLTLAAASDNLTALNRRGFSANPFRRMTMAWTKPEFTEVTLSMEVTAYVNTDDEALPTFAGALVGADGEVAAPAVIDELILV